MSSRSGTREARFCVGGAIVNINQTQALLYEIRSSWWASWVSNPFLQDLAGRYFAWKVQRKFGRYQQMIATEERLRSLLKRAE